MIFAHPAHYAGRQKGISGNPTMLGEVDPRVSYWRMEDVLGASPGTAFEQAYLIGRGVRSLAIVGNCPSDQIVVDAALSYLAEAGCDGAIPFAIPRADGVTDCGYASEVWAIDLLRWAESNAVPSIHRHRIVGLLLGYSPRAVAAYEEASASLVPASS